MRRQEWTPPGTVNKHTLEREGIIFYLRSNHDLNPDPKRPLSLVIRSEIIPLWHAPRCVKLSWRAFVTNSGFLIFKSRTRNILQTELNLHGKNPFFFTLQADYIQISNSIFWYLTKCSKITDFLINTSHLYNDFVIFQILAIQFTWCFMSPQHQHTIRLTDTNFTDTGTPMVIHTSKFNTQNQKPCSQGKYCCCLSLLQIKVCFISWCRYPSLQTHLYKF